MTAGFTVAQAGKLVGHARGLAQGLQGIGGAAQVGDDQLGQHPQGRLLGRGKGGAGLGHAHDAVIGQHLGKQGPSSLLLQLGCGVAPELAAALFAPSCGLAVEQQPELAAAGLGKAEQALQVGHQPMGTLPKLVQLAELLGVEHRNQGPNRFRRQP